MEGTIADQNAIRRQLEEALAQRAELNRKISTFRAMLRERPHG